VPLRGFSPEGHALISEMRHPIALMWIIEAINPFLFSGSKVIDVLGCSKFLRGNILHLFTTLLQLPYASQAIPF
jgi:hypothetical protein